jgi:hypothetical protein
MRSDYTGICLLLFFSTIGLLMIAYGGWQFRYYYRGRWVPARGRVLEAKPEWCGEYGGEAENGLYHPYIRFAYLHNGVEHESERFYPMGNEYMATLGDIQRFLKPYGDGAEIDIHINTADGNAVVVLDKANRSRDHFLAVAAAGMGLILSGLLFLWLLHGRGWH